MPAEVQVRARLPHPAGADAQPALRHPRPPGARALPRRRRGSRSTRCTGCSTRAGGAAASATPTRSASCAARPTPRCSATTSACRAEDVRAGLVRARVPVPLGPHMLRGRVDRVDRLPGRRLRAHRLQDRPPEDARRSCARTSSSRSTRSARARRGSSTPPQQSYHYVLDDEKVPAADRGDRPRLDRRHRLQVADGILGQGFEPTPSYAACSMCDYRIVCPAAER